MVLISLLSWLLLAPSAWAGTEHTSDSLDRLEELLQLRVEEGRLVVDEVLPAVVVSTSVRYEASEGWFTTRVLEVLQGAFGDAGLRLCAACMAPRAYVEDGALAYQTGPVALDEIVRLDTLSRGDSEPARSAIWVEEHRGGVSVRVVDLGTGRVLFAQNIDPGLVEYKNTRRMYSLSEELERRARGDSLTQVFADFAIYPGQHLSVDWTDQWGETNANLSGVTISAFDPVLGVGGCHYRRMPLANILLGGQVLVSLPTAAVRSLADTNADILDPLLTAVGVMRVPFGRSNYGAVLTVSTNGQVGAGISLMNISFLPVHL